MKKPEKEDYRTVWEHFDKGWIHQENLWDNRDNDKSIGRVLRHPLLTKQVMNYLLDGVNYGEVTDNLKERIDFSIQTLKSLGKYKPHKMSQDQFKNYLCFVVRNAKDKPVFTIIIRAIQELIRKYNIKKK